MISARSEKMKKGLQDFINYIDKTFAVKKLTILEIGSFVGDSTEIFARNFHHVISVDPYKQHLFDKGLQKYEVHKIEQLFLNKIKNFDNIYKVKKESLEYAKELKGFVDVVYIDGLHNYESVKHDIKAWLPHTRLYIGGHDYWQGRFGGVIRAVKENFGKPDRIFCDYSWIKKIC